MVFAVGVHLLPLPAVRVRIAEGVVLLAVGYNLAVEWALWTGRTSRFQAALVTLADVLLNAGTLLVVGRGFDSPCYFFAFPLVVEVALRFGLGLAMAAALLTVAADALGHLPLSAWAASGSLFKATFLLSTALLASFLYLEASAARRDLERDLDESDALDRFTKRLAGTLERAELIQEALAAAAELWGAAYAMYLDPLGDRALPPGGESEPLYDQLEDRLREWATSAGPAPALRACTLATGVAAAAFRLRLPERSPNLGALVVAGTVAQPLRVLDAAVLESALRRLALAIDNATLYRQVGDHGQELELAYAALERAYYQLIQVDQARTDFLANVSHEFRTPLSSIRAFSELLLSYDDPAVRDQFLGIITAESERLTSIVDAVLEITRLDGGYVNWQFDRVDVAALLAEIAADFRTLHLGAVEFALDIEEPLLPIVADRPQLRSAIERLLDNAFKFTEAGRITLRAAVREGELRICVTDTGRGIRPQDAGRVFEKFLQLAPPRSGKPRGVGLGLPICRQIVERHGGRVELRPDVPVGAQFSIVLPVAYEAAVEQPA